MPNLYKRGETWWARFKVNGFEYRRSLHTPVRGEAERRLTAYKRQVEREARFNITAPRTFAAAVEEWAAEGTAHLSASTIKRYMTSIKQVWSMLSDTHVHRIDVEKLRELERARRIGGATNATIRRDLTAISMVLRYAIEAGWMEEINPTLALRTRRSMKETRDPIVLPDPADIEAVKAKCPPRLADAIDFARATGMRLEEIFSLTYRQVSGEFVTVIKGKRKKLRVVPLTAKARKIIARQPQFIGSPFVFHQGNGKRWASPSSSFGNIERRVKKAAQKAAQEFHWFRFHDLRHLFAVEYLRGKKGSLYDLQQILGHTSIKTTEIYLDYLTPEQRKAALYGVAQNVAQV